MSERKIKGAKYNGSSTTFYVGPQHVPPGAVVTAPPDAVDALCTHPACEIIYDALEGADEQAIEARGEPE